MKTPNAARRLSLRRQHKYIPRRVGVDDGWCTGRHCMTWALYPNNGSNFALLHNKSNMLIFAFVCRRAFLSLFGGLVDPADCCELSFIWDVWWGFRGKRVTRTVLETKLRCFERVIHACCERYVWSP